MVNPYTTPSSLVSPSSAVLNPATLVACGYAQKKHHPLEALVLVLMLVLLVLVVAMRCYIEEYDERGKGH